MSDQLGAFIAAARAREAALMARLTTANDVDRTFQKILALAYADNQQARQQLDVLENEIRSTARDWPALNTPAVARQFQAYLAGKTRQIMGILDNAAISSERRTKEVLTLAGHYAVDGVHGA